MLTYFFNRLLYYAVAGRSPFGLSIIVVCGNFLFGVGPDVAWWGGQLSGKIKCAYQIIGASDTKNNRPNVSERAMDGILNGKQLISSGHLKFFSFLISNTFRERNAI